MKKVSLPSPYDYQKHHSIEDFIEAVMQMDMEFSSQSLARMYKSSQEMHAAIARAMRICGSIGLPLERHFMRRFVANNMSHDLDADWKLSKVAYILALINGNPDHPMVGRMQWELLKRMV